MTAEERANSIKGSSCEEHLGPLDKPGYGEIWLLCPGCVVAAIFAAEREARIEAFSRITNGIIDHYAKHPVPNSFQECELALKFIHTLIKEKP